MISKLLPVILKMLSYFVDNLIEDMGKKAEAQKRLKEFLDALEDAGLKSVKLRKSIESQRDRLKARLEEL